MKTKPHVSVLFAAWVFSFFLAGYARSAEPAPTEGEYIVYIGTYTGKESKGIYAYRFDSATGRVSSLGLAAEATNPSWLTVHPNRQFLYAANETSDNKGAKSGVVSAFAVDRKSGELTFLNQVPSRGADPCHATVDETGKNLLVANYSSGNIAVFRLHDDGRLGEASAFVQHTGSSVNPARQKGPHAHSIEPSPDNRFVLTADLGLDQLLVYRFDAAKGSLTPNDPPFAQLNPGVRGAWVTRSPIQTGLRTAEAARLAEAMIEGRDLAGTIRRLAERERDPNTKALLLDLLRQLESGDEGDQHVAPPT